MGDGGAAPGGGEELSQGSGEGAESAGADRAQGGAVEHPTRGKRFSGVTLNSSLPGPARPEAHGQGAGQPAGQGQPVGRKVWGRRCQPSGRRQPAQSHPLTLPLEEGRGG